MERVHKLIEDKTLDDRSPEDKLVNLKTLHHEELVYLMQQKIASLTLGEIESYAIRLLNYRIKYGGTLGNCYDVMYDVERPLTPDEKKMLDLRPKAEVKKDKDEDLSNLFED